MKNKFLFLNMISPEKEMKGREREMNHLSLSPSLYEISKIKMRCDRHECDGLEIDICLSLFRPSSRKIKTLQRQ